MTGFREKHLGLSFGVSTSEVTHESLLLGVLMARQRSWADIVGFRVAQLNSKGWVGVRTWARFFGSHMAVGWVSDSTLEFTAGTYENKAYKSARFPILLTPALSP